mgnify:CR=1 FL=1
MKRRLFSLLLAVCMLLMILPATSLAEEIPSAPAEAGAATPVQDGDATPSASPAQSPAAEEGQKPQEEVRIEPVQPDDAYLTVVFQDKDGGEIATVVAKNGESVSAPAAPEVAGSKFVGWYAGDNKVEFPFAVAITADAEMTVQARYDGALYVFFHSHDGSIVETRSGKTGDVISVSGVSYPLAEDQSITGWCTDTALTKPVNSVTLENSNIDLYAKVETGYWITFESNGGSYVEPMFFAANTVAQPPAAPVQHGYVFAGWHTDEALTQPANFAQIKVSTKLYAKWTERTDVQYTVQHMIENADNDGYSLKETETKRGQTGALTRATANKYDGFTAQAITQETIQGDGSTMVKVYYKRNVYSVTFWSIKWQGGYFSGKYVKDKEFTQYRITAKYGANISKKWPGGNWTTSPGGSTYQANIDTMPLGGDEFFKVNQQGNAKAEYYLEDLNGNFVLDHTDLGPDDTYVTNEDRYPITGFTCDTAKSTKNGNSYNGAKFYYNRNSYKIVFFNGGLKDKTVDVKYQQDISNQDYTPTTPPVGKTDHTFSGWYVDEECTSRFVFAGETMPAYNITLYAGWDGRDYTVTAHGKSDHAETVEKGDIVSPDLFASVIPDVGEGETFMGWTEQQGSTRLFNFATQITRDIHLYPVIMDGKTYTLTYDANGGTGTVPTDSNKYAKGTYAQVASGSGLTRQGMIFLGWSTDQNAVSPAYYPGGSVKINDNTTLYAVWGTPTGKAAITYHSNFGNDQTRKSEDKPINSLITVEGYGNLYLPSRTGYEFTGWNTASDGSGTAYAAGATARLTAGGNDLYAQWKAGTYSYTVEYYIDGVKNDSLTETGQAEYGAEISTYPNKCPANYRLDQTENLPLTIGVSGNVIKVYYVKNVFTLTIQYLYAGGGKAAEDHVESLMQDTAYSVTSPEISGYTVDKATVSGSMPAKDVTETVTYTKRNDLSYTVNYYWNGTDTKVKESKKVDGKTFQESVTESPETIEGYTPVRNDTATITIGVKDNVINFYYYKNVKLTANSGSFTYNGQPHTVEGYTCDTAGVNFEGITAAETQTAVGNYPVNFAGNPVGKIDATAKYIVVEANPGALVITAHAGEVVVMIRGKSDTKVYDGKEYTVTGYDVESISNPNYTATDFTFNGTAKAERTRFGKTEMGLKPENFTNNNQNFANVIFVVEDGYIDITKRPLNLVGETDTKPYTGNPIILNQFTAAGLANGDTIDPSSVSYRATGTMPNEYSGVFKGTPKVLNGETDVTDCYEIIQTPGKLTITKATETVVVRIVGNTKTVTYNGSEQSVEGFTADVGNKLITVTLKEGRKAEAKGILPNKYLMNLKAEDFDIKSDVYENFEVSVEDGWLQIEPTEAEVTVTITGNRRTVTYNGSEQSAEGFTTDVGDKPITVMLKDGGKAEAKGRYVGRYMMGLTAKDFKVDSTVYKNVKVIVIDGYLDIQPVYNPSVYPDYDPTPTPSPSYVPDPYRSPKTGDDSRIALWLTLMGLSAAAIAGVIVFDKKRRRS